MFCRDSPALKCWAIVSRPFHGLPQLKRDGSPAVNCWASLSRPLRGPGHPDLQRQFCRTRSRVRQNCHPCKKSTRGSFKTQSAKSLSKAIKTAIDARRNVFGQLARYLSERLMKCK
jgi:hypothetical protein